MPLAEGGWPTVAPSAVAFGGYAARALSTRTSIAGDRRRLRRAAAASRRRRLRAASSSTPPTATCCTSSSRRCRTTAPTPTAARSRTARACCSRSCAPCAPRSATTSRCFVRFSRHRLGRGRLGRGADRDRRRLGRARPAPTSSTSRPAALVAGVRIPLGPGYQVPFAERVGDDADVPVTAVGLITTPQQADADRRDGPGGCRDARPRDCCATRTSRCAPPTSSASSVDYWPPQYVRARPRWHDELASRAASRPAPRRRAPR